MALPTPRDYLGPDLPPGYQIPYPTSRAGFHLACTRGEMDMIEAVLGAWVYPKTELRALLIHGLDGAIRTGTGTVSKSAGAWSCYST